MDNYTYEDLHTAIMNCLPKRYYTERLINTTLISGFSKQDINTIPGCPLLPIQYTLKHKKNKTEYSVKDDRLLTLEVIDFIQDEKNFLSFADLIIATCINDYIIQKNPIEEQKFLLYSLRYIAICNLNSQDYEIENLATNMYLPVHKKTVNITTEQIMNVNEFAKELVRLFNYMFSNYEINCVRHTDDDYEKAAEIITEAQNKMIEQLFSFAEDEDW